MFQYFQYLFLFPWYQRAEEILATAANAGDTESEELDNEASSTENANDDLPMQTKPSIAIQVKVRPQVSDLRVCSFN